MPYSPESFCTAVWNRAWDYSTEEGCIAQLTRLLLAYPMIGQGDLLEYWIDEANLGVNDNDRFSRLQNLALSATQQIADYMTGTDHNPPTSQQGDGTLSSGGYGWGGFGISPQYDDYASNWATFGFDVQRALVTGQTYDAQVAAYINALAAQNAAQTLDTRYNDVGEGLPDSSVYAQANPQRSGHDYGTAAPISGYQLPGSARSLTEGEQAAITESQDNNPNLRLDEVIVFASRQVTQPFAMDNTIYVPANIAALDFSVAPSGKALVAHEFHIKEQRVQGVVPYGIKRFMGTKIDRIYEWDIDLANPRVPFTQLGIEQRAEIVESYMRALLGQGPVDYAGPNPGIINAVTLRQYIYGH